MRSPFRNANRPGAAFLGVLVLAFLPPPLGFGPIATAQQNAPEIVAVGELPEGFASGRAAPFLEAFNTGDEEVIADFVETDYATQNPKMTAAYLIGVAREIGPVEVHSVERIVLFDEPREIIWLRGQRTHALIGLELRTEPDQTHRLTGQSVLRGLRPLHNSAFTFPDLDVETYFTAYLSGLAEHDHFSGTVLVARGGRILFEGAYGLADRETNTPNTLDTRFRLASVTKMFTGVAAAQLAQANRLNFDDTISQHIPEYPEHIAVQVTIHQLLTHQSGIELDEYGRYNAAIAKAESMDDVLQAQLQFIEHLNRGNYDDFAPLDAFDYSNEGIDLVGVIVERASAMPWAEYIQSYIFEPAGMTNTGVGFPADAKNIATGYSSFSRFGSPVADRRPVKSVSEIGSMRPAGTGWSTARDLFRFLESLRAHRLLSPEFTGLLWQPRVKASQIDMAHKTQHYGYCFEIVSTNGIRSVGHRGDAPGASTGVRMYPDQGWIAIVLSNYDRSGEVVLNHIEECITAHEP